ncbi:hypothetical protein H1D32_09275 [Anaerobacillus sp. CMMVII]|uniref:hypothetical protein n=1 Tax=Anaerobacillus sp. CMMVII TaxID=2755588 RepID=UPI0021B7ECAC|nr:hypothetical protein [Anaerobacillus sp. CMMVII]MCT8137928.1 hypothetical protein [Anaerobacillus sp. CMMVII]
MYCSIQVVKEQLPPLELTKTYFHWLSTASKKLIKVTFINHQYQLFIRFIPKPLLVLTLQQQTPEKVVLGVTGGLLATPKQKGTFTFMKRNKCSIIALEHFQPRLPWWFYRATQAPIHELVMIYFLKHLSKNRLGEK